MTVELHAAFDLSRAIEKVEALKSFPVSAQFSETDLSWNCGSALTGYHELRKAMAEIVSERWCEIRDEAIRRAEAELERARSAMRATLRTGEKP